MGNGPVQNVPGNGTSWPLERIATQENFVLAASAAAAAFNQWPSWPGFLSRRPNGTTSYLPAGQAARLRRSEDIRVGEIVPPDWRDYPARSREDVTTQYFDRFFASPILQHQGHHNATTFFTEVSDSFHRKAETDQYVPTRDYTLARWHDLRVQLSYAATLTRHMHLAVQQAAANPALAPYLGLADAVAKEFFHSPMQSIIHLGTPDLVPYGADRLTAFWRDYPNILAIRNFYDTRTVGNHIFGLDSDYDDPKACLGRGWILWRSLEEALAYGLPGTREVGFGPQGWWARMWSHPKPWVESMNYARNPASLGTTLQKHMVKTPKGIETLLLTTEGYKLGDGDWIPRPRNRTIAQWQAIATGTNTIVARAQQLHGDKWWYCHSG